MDSPTPDPHRELGGDPDTLPAPIPARLSTDLVHTLRPALLRFFDARARDLPWRRTDDPYRIWVSEIMLQQTRVDTVVPYYDRWMERFPDVVSLADAELGEVLKLWEGLGYYRRARMLHRAAGRVRDRGGSLPDTAEGLADLPGVGPYTAGAVASIAFGRREPAVDGNVRRVLSRILDLPDPSPSELRRLAGALVPAERPGDFNQAIMELGATVCTPRSPDCGACPVSGPCRARELGIQDERPVPRRRPEVPSAGFGVAVAVRDGGGGQGWLAALVRRPVDGMLGGLWEFPGARTDEPDDGLDAARRAARGAGIGVGAPDRELPVVDHVYSHLRARYRPYLFRVGEGAALALDDADDPPIEADARTGADGLEAPGANGLGATRADARLRWMTPTDLADAALPRAQRIIADTVTDVLADAEVAP